MQGFWRSSAGWERASGVEVPDHGGGEDFYQKHRCHPGTAGRFRRRLCIPAPCERASRFMPTSRGRVEASLRLREPKAGARVPVLPPREGWATHLPSLGPSAHIDKLHLPVTFPGVAGAGSGRLRDGRGPASAGVPGREPRSRAVLRCVLGGTSLEVAKASCRNHSLSRNSRPSTYRKFLLGWEIHPLAMGGPGGCQSPEGPYGPAASQFPWWEARALEGSAGVGTCVCHVSLTSCVFTSPFPSSTK